MSVAQQVDVADLAARPSALPYRWTRASGIRANRWCSRSSMVIAGGCAAPSTLAITVTGAMASVSPSG